MQQKIQSDFDPLLAYEREQGRFVFQYLVTTTTQPPIEFQKQPWLRLELRGAPSSELLVRFDLP